MLDEKCRVLAHQEIGNGYRYLIVEAPQMAEKLAPGQFVHVKVPTLEMSALRRPFSVFDATDGMVVILYKTVGRGTTALNAVGEGAEISILGPLGHGFPATCSGTALLVGGGFGVAPLHFLAKRLAGRKILFAGGRTRHDVLAVDRFRLIPDLELKLATNDGSLGVKGFVTLPLDETIAGLKAKGEPFELFACGPDGLLKAVTDRARANDAPGWISCDRHMICGVGACYACIQKTVRGNSRCCIEGPVFAAKDLIWE
ncbi:MAG: dihydroorotate dehydrogenase electron transfer subunit [Kiritimatiellia bacterium]